MITTRCAHCGAVDADGRAGWLCRTCGTMLPSDRPDGKATAIAAKVARDLGCADLDDVPDALKRVLGDNADAEIHRRVLGQQADAQRTRADAAEQECARLREEAREQRAAEATARAIAMDEIARLRAIVEGRTVAPAPHRNRRVVGRDRIAAALAVAREIGGEE